MRYAVAALSVALALLATLPLQPAQLQSPLFFLAVIVSAWYGGVGPGLLAAGLATFALSYFFLPPLHSLRVSAVELPLLLVFLLSAVLVSVGSAMRTRALTVIQRSRDELEAEVQRRTTTLREQAALLDLTHDTVFVRDTRDVITYWNRGAAALYGWSAEETVGRTTHELLATVFPAPLAAINAELLRTGRWEGELIHTRRDGTKVVVASRWALQRDARGNPVATLETNNDITARRRAEEALRDSEEQWRAVFENNPTMYFMVDAAGVVLSVNPFGAEQLGYAVGDLLGRPVLDVSHEADRNAVDKNMAACLEQLGQPMSWESRKQRKDRTLVWVRESARAMLVKGRPVVLVVCEDVTERKRAEEELRTAEQRLRAVIASTPIILFALDRSGVFTLSEGRALDPVGLVPGQVVGQSIFELYRDLPQVLAGVRRALAGEALTDVVDVYGAVFETHFRPFFDDAGAVAGVNAVATNITERRRAEDDLRESERRYRNIFESAGVSIWEEDFSAIRTAIDELRVRGVRDLQAYIATHPEFVRAAIGMVKISDVNEATVRLFGAKSKTELLGALDRVFLPETEEVFRGELLAIADGRPSFASETALRTLDGERLTVLFTITFPPPPSALDRVLVTIMDITERKRAEEALQKAQAELAHVTRVTTLGELAASIAHEVNQPLAAIVADATASLNWLAAPEPDLASVRDALGSIATDGHRAADVIQRIRDLAKRTDPRQAPQDVNEIIEDVILLVRTELQRARATLRIELARPLPPVLGDRVQLQQVLINLVVNGIEAMAPVDDRPRDLVIRSEQHGAGQVAVAVCDSGVGISPRDADRLFDAFFTTKSRGMGMGLSISRTIIEAHGGRLSATANPDHGATFRFILPIAA